MKINKEVLIFKDINEIADYVLEWWKELSEITVTGKGQFTAAISGGKTPVAFYQKLSTEKNLQWDKIHVFLVDERFVPYESGENNYHSINKTLLRHVAIPARNVHPILTSESSPQVSAKRYEKDLISYFKITGSKLPQFDLILLGMGEDGHTASLFPDTASVKEKKHLAIAVSPEGQGKKDRITITLPVINNARNIMFLITGKNKAKVVRDVIEGKNNLLPAAMVRPENGRLFFLLDESAGALLKKD